jgi:hypothetical protein
MKREVKANIENDEKKKKKSNGKKLVSITMAVIMLLSISITPFGAVMADNETATVPDNETILTTPDNETTPIPSPTPSPANETASSVNETTSTPPPENETVSEPTPEPTPEPSPVLQTVLKLLQLSSNYNVNLTVEGAKTASKATNPGVNATYILTVNNTGNLSDNYTLSVDNPDNADVAALNIIRVDTYTYNITNLASGATQDVLLNVTDGSDGTYRVNVTVISEHDPVNATDYITTTTTVYVPVAYGVNLTVEGAKTATKTTALGVNATYTLTVKNTGTSLDNYTLVVDNPDGASVAALSGNVTPLDTNIYKTVDIPGGESVTVLLSVTNAIVEAFRVNVIANSTGDPTKVDYINTITILYFCRNNNR